MSEIEYNIELSEFLEQVNYALSFKFREKWRYRFSTTLISVFQDRLLKALKEEKPVKKSSLISLLTKKHKYSLSEVENFFREIDISLFYPLVLHS